MGQEHLPLIAVELNEMTNQYDGADLDLDCNSSVGNRRSSKPPFIHSLFACLQKFQHHCPLFRRAEMTSRSVGIPQSDNVEKRHFPVNRVKNQKHSAILFLPAVLFEQFRTFLNLFFLVMAMSQFVPQLRIGYLSTYWGPLGFVMTITLWREAYDDFKRYIRDKELNGAQYEMINETGSKSVKSSHIRVGDVIKLHRNQRVPADAVLLHTSDKSGTCFVRTDQLDGETDWKLKVACPSTQQIDSESSLFDLTFQVFAEKPQKNIHVFFGTFKEGDHEEALNVDNILWADTVLAAGTALCLIVYTGSETRAALNTSQPRSKLGLFDREVNNLTKILFVLAFVLAIVMVALKGFKGVWPVTFFRFLLLFSYIIPLSLRVNLDMAKIVYAKLISTDKTIPDAVVRSSTIPEELGRIEYMLCDKTGTLTQNTMIFKKLHLGTLIFNQENFEDLSSQLKNFYKAKNENAQSVTATKVAAALEAIVLCNNVNPIEENGEITYQASSPDEIALVTWAKGVGFELLRRDLHSIAVVEPDGQERRYNILETFPFSPDRKRMGIVLQEENAKQATFFIKGADVAVMPLVGYSDWLEEECANMAREGLRTLVVAKKKLTIEQFNSFMLQYNRAKTSLYDRQSKLEAVLASLECNMELTCLTGVEDLLQPSVPSTLESLRTAGVKIWMLTGDKMETAVCIAKSSGLVDRNHNLLLCPTVCTVREGRHQLEKLRRTSNAALVITSVSLEFYLDHLAKEFVQVTSNCAAVVCCRCSPEQKAQVARTLKKYNNNKLVAAVGDGGNDVSMIQAADVGIGIVGKEGRHASLAADFSISNFHSIARLMLVHGRLCYRRSCSLSQFIIHRGLIISTMQAIFSCVFYFASISLYPGMLMVLYSTIYTMFPVFSLVMDRDVSDDVLMNYPELYRELIKGRSLSLKTFLLWFLVSMYQGAVIMYGGIFLFESDFIHIVSISFTSLVITELIMVALTVHTWHWAMMAAEGLSLSIYMLSLMFLPHVFDLKFVQTWTFAWKTSVLTAIGCAPLMIFKLMRLMFVPPDYAKLS